MIILSEPEGKKILDTLFMRQYRKGKNDDMKFLAIVAGFIVLVVTIFVVWLVTRLDMPDHEGPPAPAAESSPSAAGDPVEEAPKTEGP